MIGDYLLSPGYCFIRLKATILSIKGNNENSLRSPNILHSGLWRDFSVFFGVDEPVLY